MIGTGSKRRKYQLLKLRPDLKVVGIRGNIDTRLRKLYDGEIIFEEVADNTVNNNEIANEKRISIANTGWMESYLQRRE